MRNVATFARFTEAVTLHSFRENDSRLTFMFRRRFVGRVHLARVVTAAHELGELHVREMMHELEQLRIPAKEMFPHVAARLDDVFLIIAVHRFFHSLEQQTALVAREQIIPIRAPDDFDDIPTRTTERCFKFLDDLAVAAHRAIETLQVAIDDPDQVVEILARCERGRAERFRFIALAVADEAPDLRFILCADKFARLQVAIKSRLVDGHDWAKAHRNRRELPERRHQVRMRIRRKPATFRKFLPEVEQMLFRDATFEKRTGINTRRGVTLEINFVARKVFRAAAKEMIESHLIQRRRRRVARNVAADVRGGVRFHNHRHGVPAHEALEADFGLPIAGVRRLRLDRDGVHVRRIEPARQFMLTSAELVGELLQQLRRAICALSFERQFHHGLH